VEPFSCRGTYTDDRGTDEFVWSFQPSTREGWTELYGRYEIRATIRGVPVWGGDLDGLEPEQLVPAGTVLPLNRADELTDCILTGDLPCTVHAGAQVIASVVRFRLDLRHQDHPEKHLTLSCVLAGVEFSVTDDWFEDGVLCLERALPVRSAYQGVRDLPVLGLLPRRSRPHGDLLPPRCQGAVPRRAIQARLLECAGDVPVTEDVPETYLCEEYQRRIPGTGYRG
jgi:hypothetical protein